MTADDTTQLRQIAALIRRFDPDCVWAIIRPLDLVGNFAGISLAEAREYLCGHRRLLDAMIDGGMTHAHIELGLERRDEDDEDEPGGEVFGGWL